MKDVWTPFPRTLLAALALTSVAACAERGVEQAADPTAPALIEELLLGADASAPPEFQFADVLDILQLADGSFWVLDGSGGRLVRRYRSDGTYLGAVAREGGGPGEYANPRRLVQLPDGRVVLIDPGAVGRLELFTPAGTHAGTLAVADAPPWSDNARAHLGHDGLLYVEAGLRADAPGSGRSWLAVDPGTGAAHTIPLVPPAELTREPGLELDGMPGLYLPGLEATLGADGRPWWVRTDDYRLLRVAADGTAEEVVARQAAAVPVAAGERRQLEAAQAYMLAERVRGGTVPAVPAVKPLIRSLDTTADGRLLVHLHAPSRQVDGEWTEDMVWEVFDATGTSFEGRIELPGDQEILALAGDILWVMARDSLGVERLTRFRLGT